MGNPFMPNNRFPEKGIMGKLIDDLTRERDEAREQAEQAAMLREVIGAERDRMRQQRDEAIRAREAAEGQLSQLREEAQTDEWYRETTMRILNGVAVALNGPEPPLTKWSHHDLAEKADALLARLRAAECKLAEMGIQLDE